MKNIKTFTLFFVLFFATISVNTASAKSRKRHVRKMSHARILKAKHRKQVKTDSPRIIKKSRSSISRRVRRAPSSSRKRRVHRRRRR